MQQVSKIFESINQIVIFDLFSLLTSCGTKWSSSTQNSHFHLLLSALVKQHPFDLKFRPWIEFDFHIYHTRRFFFILMMLQSAGMSETGCTVPVFEFWIWVESCLQAHLKYAFMLMAYWWAKTEATGYFQCNIEADQVTLYEVSHQTKQSWPAGNSDSEYVHHVTSCYKINNLLKAKIMGWSCRI